MKTKILLFIKGKFAVYKYVYNCEKFSTVSTAFSQFENFHFLSAGNFPLIDTIFLWISSYTIMFFLAGP